MIGIFHVLFGMEYLIFTIAHSLNPAVILNYRLLIEL